MERRDWALVITVGLVLVAGLVWVVFYVERASSVVDGVKVVRTAGDLRLFHKHARRDRLNLEGVIAPRVRFEDLDMRWANFRRANLRDARFVSVDLRGADFRGAEVDRAAFSGGTRLDGAVWVDGRVCGEDSVDGCRLPEAGQAGR